MMSRASGELLGLRVGDWYVEPELSRIRCDVEPMGRDEQTVHLEPKVMQLLCFLATSGGRPRTRDEIRAALWPDVVVGDDSLHQVVCKLRRALGDCATRPRYVETVTRLGYRLLVDVELDCGSPRSAPGSPKHAWLRIALPVSFMLATWLAAKLGSSKSIPRALARSGANGPASRGLSPRALAP